MRRHLGRLVFSCSVLVAVGCSGGTDQTASTQPEASASPGQQTQASQPQQPTTALDATHACNLLAAADFESVGLSQGKAKPDRTISGTECTWNPVLGGGGFLHLQTLGAEQFEKRKQRAIESDAKKSASAGGEMITIEGLGDEAFVQKWKPNETITVRVGDKAFHISGNARLKQPQLESLARAVVTSL